MIKIRLSVKDEKISYIMITGDFFLHPETLLTEIESSLIGMSLDEEELTALIMKTLDRENANLIGATPRDLAKAIALAS